MWQAILQQGIADTNNGIGALEARRSYNLAGGYLNDALRGIRGTNYEAGNAWEGAQEDPTGRNAQLDVLHGLGDIYQNRGWDAGSRATFQQGVGQAQQYERGQRQAAVSGAQMRGGYSAGQGLAANLAGAQTGANMVGGYARDATGDARLRALSALTGAGQVGQELRRGDQAFQTNRLDATNSINTFNAAQRRGQALDVLGAQQARASNVIERGKNAQGFLGKLGGGGGFLSGFGK